MQDAVKFNSPKETKQIMKKLFAVVLTIILLCGCNTKPKNTETFNLPIQAIACLEGSDAFFTVTVWENESTIVFDPKHALAGTELYFSPEGNKATIGEFTREIKSGSFPAQEALIKALKALCQSSAKATETDYGEKYTIDEMTVMVYYNKDTESINGIGTEENGRYFKFNILSLSHYEGQSCSSG